MNDQQTNTEARTILIDRNTTVPYMGEWLGYWLMEPGRFQKRADIISGMNIALHVGAVQSAKQQAMAAAAEQGETVGVRRGYSYELRDGVAVLELAGSLMKHEESGEESTSTVMARNTLRRMASDRDVSAIIIDIDSPGGTVSGAYDLADDIRKLAATKPTFAYIRNLGASAAYLQAVQTKEISAGRTALIGSIGTVGVVHDLSTMATLKGIQVHVIAARINGVAAPYKGAGTPGSKVTPEQLSRWQEEIDALNGHFLDAVEAGRKGRMTRQQVEAAADGGVWIASEAKARGLIDRVESFDEMYERVRGVAAKSAGGARQSGEPPTNEKLGGTSAGENPNPASAAEGSDMSQTNGAAPVGGQTKSTAETLAELKTACPGASSDFIMEQATSGASVEGAKTAFIGWQAAQVRDRDDQIAALKIKNLELDAKIEAMKSAIENSAATAAAATAGGNATAGNAGASGAANAPARPGVPPATSTAAEAPAAGADAGSDDPKEKAKAEWAANTGGCKSSFSSERAYVGYRTAELAGKVSRSKVA